MEKSKRFKRGLEVIKEYEDKSDKPAFSITFDSLMDLDPELEDYIVEFAFGAIYSREGLDHKQKSLLTIASVVTQSLMPQLKLHVNMGLTGGLTRNELVDSAVHLLPSVGFPRVLMVPGVGQS